MADSSEILLLDTTTILTDESPYEVYFVDVSDIRDLVIDIKLNKSAIIVIAPCFSESDDTLLGEPRVVVALPNMGGIRRGEYEKIAAYRAKVVVTKIEDGNTLPMRLSIRGTTL